METSTADGGLCIQAADRGGGEVAVTVLCYRGYAGGKVNKIQGTSGVQYIYHPLLRYAIASIARNNLVAAAQNIQGAQRYLSNVQFPYCAPAEVATLAKATAYIFTDMQTMDRHQHALDCYSTTAMRCGALLQWINQVNIMIMSLVDY